MAETRLLLNEQNKPVVGRINSALKTTDEMLAHPAYKKYATGLLLRARLKTYLMELEMDTFKSDALTEDAALSSTKIGEISDDINAALVVDPNLVRFIRFRSLSLNYIDESAPANLVKLKAIALADRSKEKALLADINAALGKLEIELKDTLRPLLRDGKIVQAKIERQMARAMRAGVGEALLNDQIVAARAGHKTVAAAKDLFPLFQNVVNSAIGIGKLHTAELYLMELKTEFMDKKSDALTVEQQKFVTDAIQSLKTERLADVMFDVI